MKTSKLSKWLFGYLIFICTWFSLWLTSGDSIWWLVVLNRSVPYLFLPVPFLLLGLMQKREYKFMGLLILPISLYSFLYHPYLFPKLSKPDGSHPDLTVMTYNILYTNHDYDAIANVILTHRPDLVALQEVLPGTMTELEARLAEEYPYSLQGYNKKFAVSAVFSRYPITETSVLTLGEDHRAVIVKAEVGQRTITFVAVHLRAYNLQWVRPITNVPQTVLIRTTAQNWQVEQLWENLRTSSGPVIIGCDCNSKETSSSYRMLDQWFDSTAYQVGWQLPGIDRVGARQDTNLQHIDYIWYRGELDPLAAYEIIDDGGSDHHPVLALFEFQ